MKKYLIHPIKTILLFGSLLFTGITGEVGEFWLGRGNQ
jgi:hypothetical protein